MPEVEYSALVSAPVAVVWEFTKDMNNWAPFIAGYQTHVQRNDTDSLWTLKGDIGAFSRTVSFQVHITEWNGPERVAFQLKGVNEPLDGEGVFTAAPVVADPASPATAPAPAAPWWQRLRDWLVRRVFAHLFGRGPAPAPSTPLASAQARITFHLTLNAGGATGPMVNVLLAPMLTPVAEQLANSIAAQVESRHRGVPG